MQISEIIIYPIKSLGGISVQSSLVEHKGLQYDRRWMLVNEKNEFLTQRNFGLMSTLKVALGQNGLRVFNKEKEIQIPFEPLTGETASVKIWSDRVRAEVYNADVNSWFTEVLGKPTRLVLMPEAANRKVNYYNAVHKEDTVSFADACPFLVTGENSLNDLNGRLEKQIPMNRFRPNFAVTGSEAFAEDSWKKIRIGKAIFHGVKQCARCVVTSIDQRTGISDGIEPLRTMAIYRIPKRSIKKKIIFGQYLIAENPGETIKIGQAVEILETKN